MPPEQFIFKLTLTKLVLFALAEIFSFIPPEKFANFKKSQERFFLINTQKKLHPT
jgi:hypothetical protein